MRRAAAATLMGSAIALGGCVTPTVESHVFWTHPGAKLVQAPDNLPVRSKSRSLNNYKGVPGSIGVPIVVSSEDVFRQRPAVWNIDKRCPHRAFDASAIRPISVPDGIIKYSINLSNVSLSNVLNERKSLERDFPNLPRQFIGYLDYVSIKLTNGQLLLADDEQLANASRDINRRDLVFRSRKSSAGSCRLLVQEGKYQVTGMYVADYDVDIGYSAGLDLSDEKKRRIRAAFIKSLRYREHSPRRVYAILARSI
ncbi:hypothetical protein [Bradyrhizobium sp. TM233]|uniref:hypothetical protein n=1 Tax=Bradyrhizobium sp. TM233 TaxID=2599801 RepID=UPI0030C6DE80|nr:hypothetical protein TM233_04810 [Bradyrhizobium sp. TM233]